MNAVARKDKKLSYPKEKINILLLEDVHSAAEEVFAEAGYSVKKQKAAPSEDELLKLIPSVHVLGIRSRTELTAKVLAASKHLLAVGCFCIGTNQVDCKKAASIGTPVFNAPFSNTRSVAELTLAEIVMLARKAAQRSMELHSGKWTKSAAGSHEVRGRTVGIIGYGHIGPQVGLLAESFGMKVVYYDIVAKLALGNAQALSSLDAVLKVSDYVTLHVPETARTKGMIGERELGLMKKGACLLNLSRGSVVNIKALRQALDKKHLAGAAIDVFPVEPASNDEEFKSELRGADNVILTPHIGGSTEQAQKNIGIEVATALVKYIDSGSTVGTVNFPQGELPPLPGSHRLLNIHRNIPGVLSSVNQIIADMGANIEAQYLSTSGDIGYLLMDVGPGLSRAVKKKIEMLDSNIKTRLLF